ncbi:hypothetical protein NMY22_g12273 [Coprinellus aureogranulatus]|nr:hypothetical protein NMY22_g12273 [Coprinellus aureogranulatus]
MMSHLFNLFDLDARESQESSSNMNTSADTPRSPAKSPKTETLLRSVEEGSVEHIYKLSRSDLPTNSHDCALALRAVFSLLDRETMPQPTKVCTAQCFHDNRTVTRVRYSVEVVMAAVEKLKNENSKYKESLSQALLDNLPTLLRWMRFLAEESRWAYQDLDSPETFGLMASVETLQSIYAEGSMDLRAGINASFEALDFLLYLWAWRDSAGKTLTWHYSSDGARCHLSRLFTFMVTKVTGTTHNLATMFARRTYPEHRLFIDSSFTRLEEWASIALNGNFELFSSYALETIAMTQQYELLEVPGYADAYIKAKFPSRALALAMRFPDLKVTAPYPQATFPVAVSIKFFPNDRSRDPRKA